MHENGELCTATPSYTQFFCMVYENRAGRDSIDGRALYAMHGSVIPYRMQTIFF